MSKISSIIHEICDMYVNGYTVRDIAVALNISDTWVQGVIDQHIAESY